MSQERADSKRSPLDKLLGYFGLLTFKRFLSKVTPLRRDFILKHKENQSLKSQIQALEKELKDAKDTMTKAQAVITTGIDKVREHTTFVVEHYDPAKYIEGSYSTHFASKEEAVKLYEDIIKKEKPHGIQAEVELYRKVSLRCASAERVQKK